MAALSRLLGAVRRGLDRSPNRGSFPFSVEQFRERMRDWNRVPRAAANGSRVAVLMTPWVDTAVPMFAIEIALAMRARGATPVFLLDLAQLGLNDVSAASLAALESLAVELERFGEVVAISDAPDRLFEIDEAFTALIRENCVWTTKGEALSAEYLSAHPELEIAMGRHAARVTATLAKLRLSWLLVPGGVFGLSGLYVRAARELKVDFTTFDSGPGRLFVAHRAIAAQSGDLPESHRRLLANVAADPATRAFVSAAAHQVEKDRQELRDPFGFQVAARGGDAGRPCEVLLCLNYRADTAALLRTKVFPSVAEWIRAVLNWAERRGDVCVGIRPHPVTRHARVHSTDRLDLIVKERDPEGRFSRWIPADAVVSSYDLLAAAKVVLPFTSTIGIEAAWMGKPVVLGSHAYYDSLGFAHPAVDRADYFQRIEEALAGGLIPNETQREAAALCLYLILKCRSVYTTFTPQPKDFEQWLHEPPAQLWARPELEDLAAALITREPLTWLRHLRLSACAS